MASGHLREGKGACFCALVLRQICIRPVCLVAFALNIFVIFIKKKKILSCLLFYVFLIKYGIG